MNIVVLALVFKGIVKKKNLIHSKPIILSYICGTQIKTWDFCPSITCVFYQNLQAWKSS